MKSPSDIPANLLDLPSFVKIMIGDFDTRMKIPPAFLKHVRGKYPRRFTLSGPGSDYWAVYASKVGAKVYLDQGWKEFVQENGLKEADFLVFHYRGDSSFHVTVFGRHCCLRKVEVVGKGGGGATSLDKEQEAIIVIDSDESSGDEGSDSDYDSSDDDEDYHEMSPLIGMRQGNGAGIRLKKKANRVKRPRSFIQRTNFRIIMRKTYIIKRYLSIPVAMIGHLLGSEEEYIKLMVGNKIWEVKLNVYEEAYKLGAGWLAFVKENKLKEGDVCNFQVTRWNGEVCLLVTIRRKDFGRFY